MWELIAKPEEELGQLHSWQKQLLEKQWEFQTGIHEEFTYLYIDDHGGNDSNKMSWGARICWVQVFLTAPGSSGTIRE